LVSNIQYTFTAGRPFLENQKSVWTAFSIFNFKPRISNNHGEGEVVGYSESEL
jgi:hypothetical protein